MLRLQFLSVAVLALAASVTSSPIQRREETSGSGSATWYYPGLGACGYTDSDSDSVIAVSESIYNSGYCNQNVQITNTANGNVAYGTIRDACQACGSEDLDLSPSLFQQLGSLDTGVLSINWNMD